MATNPTFQPSLLSQYDSIVRKYEDLTDPHVYFAFAKVVGDYDTVRRQCHAALQDQDTARREVAAARDQNFVLTAKVKHLTDVLERRVDELQNVTSQRDEFAQQIEVITAILFGGAHRSLLTEDEKVKISQANSRLKIGRYGLARRGRGPTEDGESTADLLSDIEESGGGEDLDSSYLRSGKCWKRSSSASSNSSQASEASEPGGRGRRKRKPSAPPAEGGAVTNDVFAPPPKRSLTGPGSSRPLVTINNFTVGAGATRRVVSDDAVPVVPPTRARPASRTDSAGSGKGLPVAVRERPGYLRQTNSSTARRGRMNRSMSESDVVKFMPPASEARPGKGQAGALKKTPSVTGTDFLGKTPSSTLKGGGGSHESRVGQHELVQKKAAFNTPVCSVCRGRIVMSNYYRCKHCPLECHSKCLKELTVFCDRMKQRTFEGGISSYCPLVGPRVPRLVHVICSELEERGLQVKGLYRCPGAESESKQVVDDILKSRVTLNLKCVDPYNLTGALKQFMKCFQEGLIPFPQWQQFEEAACCRSSTDDHDQPSALYQAVTDLPDANRDTLAYLVLHLQKVAGAADNCMKLADLATCLAPTLIGFSSLNPGSSEIGRQSFVQKQILEKLLKLPTDYWQRVLYSSHKENQPLAKTPNLKYQVSAPGISILGPLGSPSATSTMMHTPTTEGGSTRRAGRTPYYRSERKDRKKRMFPDIEPK